jgi:uncharacterized beta-barrel protein YwiB (DUF1934 family)
VKKKAIISVTSKQSVGHEDSIEVVTPGEFYKKEDLYYAIYEETEISGMEGTTTTLKISKDKLSLIRKGSTSAKMDFDRNSKNLSMYDTPYGTLELRIETKELDIEIDEDGGNIFVNYNMSLSGQTPYNTILKINIKAQE